MVVRPNAYEQLDAPLCFKPREEHDQIHSFDDYYFIISTFVASGFADTTYQFTAPGTFDTAQGVFTTNDSILSATATFDDTSAGTRAALTWSITASYADGTSSLTVNESNISFGNNFFTFDSGNNIVSWTVNGVTPSGDFAQVRSDGTMDSSKLVEQHQQHEMLCPVLMSHSPILLGRQDLGRLYLNPMRLCFSLQPPSAQSTDDKKERGLFHTV